MKVRVCRRCGTVVQKSKLPQYAFYCPEHDEDLYSFETFIKEEKHEKKSTDKK